MLVGGAARVQADGLAHISPGRQPWVHWLFFSLQANGLPHSVGPSSVPTMLSQGFEAIGSEVGFCGLMRRACSAPNSTGAWTQGCRPGRV
jgi:hypothetical protein